MKSMSTRPTFRKLGQRDQNYSTELRLQGDSLFAEGKVFEALESFNKSLCAAQLNSQDIPLTYDSRSIVYFEAGEYKLCLENIQLARDHGFPADREETLNIREEKCRNLLENHQPSEDDDPWNFFKLSYPPNKKIPFIVDCIELHNNEKYGRFVITNQDLNPGDVIAIEEPFFKNVNHEAAHTRCAKCLKCNKMNLIPCPVNKSAMFCSKECMEVAIKTFLQVKNDSKMYDIKQRMLFEALDICGGSFDKLKQMMDETDLKRKTIFDFDLSDTKDPFYKHNLLTTICSMAQVESVSNEIVRYLSHHPVLDFIEHDDNKEIAKAFLLRAFRILTVNSFGIEWVVPAKPRDINKDSIVTYLAGDGLCQFGSLLNHSCSPNVDRVFVDNKFVFFVRRPIQKGQQLFTCYGTLFIDAPRELRQETLKDEYGFDCCCEACYGDYPTSSIYPWTSVPIIITEFSKIKEWKNEFKKNCSKIIKCQNILSHSELCIVMLKNLYYLVAIAKTEPFIF